MKVDSGGRGMVGLIGWRTMDDGLIGGRLMDGLIGGRDMVGDVGDRSPCISQTLSLFISVGDLSSSSSSLVLSFLLGIMDQMARPRLTRKTNLGSQVSHIFRLVRAPC